MTLEKEVYYLSKNDLAKLETGESVDIISKDNRHIQILLEDKNKKIIVHYKECSTKVTEGSDDYENPTYSTSGKNTITKEIFSHKDIDKAFEKEDGDGDETGSWSKSIFLITDESGTILLDVDERILNYTKDLNNGADLEALNENYKTTLESAKERIKWGNF